jgi:hypothetical protein
MLRELGNLITKGNSRISRRCSNSPKFSRESSTRQHGVVVGIPAQAPAEKSSSASPSIIDELVEFTLSISARKNPSQRINISSVASTISTAITAPVATRGKSILSVYGAPSPRRRSEKDEKLILIFLAFRRLRNCLHDKTMCRERLLLLRGRQKHINLSLCGFRVPRPR